MFIKIHDFFSSIPLPGYVGKPLFFVVIFFLSMGILHLLLSPLLIKMTKYLENRFDIPILDELKRHKILRLTTSLVFLFIVNNTILAATDFKPLFLRKIFSILFAINFAVLLIRIAYAVKDIRQIRNPKDSISHYVQFLSIAVYSILAIIIISIFADQSIGQLFTVLGAFVTVLMVVFRDTLLSLVAGIQLNASNAIEIGDWIELGNEADGEVVEIGLYYIKILNGDKTISVVPSQRVASQSFKNWAEMFKANGRRVKKSIPLDPTSVRFIDEIAFEEMSQNKELTAFLKFRKEKSTQPEGSTNLDLFREYTFFYFSEIRKDVWNEKPFSLLARVLQPSASEGLPVEFYFFTKTTLWAEYETIQSETIAHFLATLPLFKLSVFVNGGVIIKK